VVRSGDDRYQPVVTGPGPTDQTSTTTVPTTTAETTSSTTGYDPSRDYFPTAAISSAPRNLSDGQLLVVTGVGFPSDDRLSITLRLCTDPAGDLDCDLERSISVEVGQADGFSVPMRFYRDLFTYQGWRSCTACSLVVGWSIGQHSFDPIRIPVRFEASSGPGLRPTLGWFDPALGNRSSAVRIGETIAVVGSNLQVDQSYTFEVCSPPSGADTSVRSCLFPGWGFVRTDATGSFRADCALGEEFLATCPDGTPCAFAMGGSIGVPPIAESPFTLLMP
jgi:hypothetical protein